MIVQTIAPGREYTVDVFVNRDGQVRCAVPRLRIETRGGEISKGLTVRSKPIQELAKRVCASLPGAQGVFNVQIFSDDPTEVLNVIESNPRFGGGYPLTHHAGGVYTPWLIEETQGRPCGATDETWSDPEGRRRHLEGIPLGKEGGLRDIGVLATYLASPASDYITGQIVYIDGGLTAK